MRARSRSLVLWAALGATAVVAIALGGTLLFEGQEPPVEVTVVAATSKPVAAPVPSAAVPASTVSLAPLESAELPDPSVEVRTVSVMDLPAAPAPVAPPAPVVGPAALASSTAALLGVPKAIAAFAATASAAPHGPPSCSPPFFYDELGLKIFKPECVK